MKKNLTFLIVALLFTMNANAKTISIGLNYPATGPYSIQGLAQLRAAEMAVEEINETGGILGRKISLIPMDTKSKSGQSTQNVTKMIDSYGCDMVFGGSSSAVAIAGGKAARSRGKLYFGTLTYSNATTGKEGHKYMFRECSNAWMGANVLADYLKIYYTGKRYYYITADYTWGWSTEKSLREFSKTKDKTQHQGIKTPFPGATNRDFSQALLKAQESKADVLVLVLFGKDMAEALKLATAMGLKESMAVVVPTLTLGMAESAGPKAMEGVVGALAWCWQIPYLFGYSDGISFVENYAKKYNCYPSSSAASAYSIVYQYKDAVERANTFKTDKIIDQLENHEFKLLKSNQVWRKFDHQCLQTVYAVKCKPESEIIKDKFRQDYFDYLTQMSGETAARTYSKWMEDRSAAGKPGELQW